MRLRRSFRTTAAAKLVLATLCAGLAANPGAAKGEEPQELVFLNWADYLDPDLVAKFEKSHNAQIGQVIFNNNYDRDQKLIEADGRGYDLAIVTELTIAPYRTRGWLAQLDQSNVPNLKYVDPRWYQLSEAAEGYTAPYFWGTLGIAYRADLVPGGITSWKQFYEPGEALKHKIVTTGDPNDLIGMALKTFGYSANSIDRTELAAAEALMLKQKPFVRSHEYIDITEKSALVTGDVAASMIYNGDVLMLEQHNANIKFVVPEEGGNLWVDYLVVFNKSNKKELARAFVNFLNEPENAAQLAQYVYYATPNLAAEKLLPADFLANPVIYPPANVLARSEIYKSLPPRDEKRRSSIYARAVN